MPEGVTSQRPRSEPTINDDGAISLWGVGPTCPGCGGPTHAVTGDPDAERPWWCKDCNVRLDDDGDYGAAAQFPSGSEPGNNRERDTESDPQLATDGGRPSDREIPEHYWVECRFCGKETVAFERYCRHCDADRQHHRDLEDRHGEPRCDGGATTEQMLVAGDRAMVSYGPGRDQDPGAWMLAFTNRGGRLEVFLDENAMYELWTEVQDVPWPRDGTAAGERRRALVRLANDASADQIQDAIEAIRADHQTAADGGSSRWKRVGLAFDRLLQRLGLLGRWRR